MNLKNGVVFSNWIKIGNSAKNLYVGGAGLFITNPSSGDIYKYDGSPMQWTKIGGPGAEFAVTKDNIFGLTGDLKGVNKYSGGYWYKTYSGPASQIIGGAPGLFKIDSNSGDIHSYDGSTWAKIGGPGAEFAVTKGRLFGLANGKVSIWQYEPTSSDKLNWAFIGEAAQKIIGGGESLFALSPDSKKIKYYDSDKSNWQVVVDDDLSGYSFTASEAGLFGLSPDKSIRFWWLNAKNNWVSTTIQTSYNGGESVSKSVSLIKAYASRLYARTEEGVYMIVLGDVKNKDKPGARQCEFHALRFAGTQSGHKTPAHPLFEAKNKHRIKRITLSGGTPKENTKSFWTPLGPYAENMESDGWFKFGAVSGRVTDIAFGPVAPQKDRPRIYAATANGGVWYSDDGGKSWRSFKNYYANTLEVKEKDMIPNTDLTSCGAIAISSDGKTIFVGTGEGNRYAAPCNLPYQGYSYEGVGVLASTDEGQNWKKEPSSPDLTGHAFFALAIDPNDPNKLLGATSNGLYLREEITNAPGNYRWTPQNMGPENGSVSSVVVASKNNQTSFFAARWGDKVYQSTDGKNWRPLDKNFPITKTTNSGEVVKVGRIGLAVQIKMIVGIKSN